MNSKGIFPFIALFGFLASTTGMILITAVAIMLSWIFFKSIFASTLFAGIGLILILAPAAMKIKIGKLTPVIGVAGIAFLFLGAAGFMGLYNTQNVLQIAGVNQYLGAQVTIAGVSPIQPLKTIEKTIFEFKPVSNKKLHTIRVWLGYNDGRTLNYNVKMNLKSKTTGKLIASNTWNSSSYGLNPILDFKEIKFGVTQVEFFQTDSTAFNILAYTQGRLTQLCENQTYIIELVSDRKIIGINENGTTPFAVMGSDVDGQQNQCNFEVAEPKDPSVNAPITESPTPQYAEISIGLPTQQPVNTLPTTGQTSPTGTPITPVDGRNTLLLLGIIGVIIAGAFLLIFKK